MITAGAVDGTAARIAIIVAGKLAEKRHAGLEAEQLHDIAAFDGQRRNLCFVEGVSESGIGSVHGDATFTGHEDLLFDGTNTEGYVDGGSRGHQQVQRIPAHGLKSFRAGFQRVAAGLQLHELISAVGVGLDFADCPSIRQGEFYFGAGDRRSARVGDASAQGSNGLGEGGRGTAK